MLKIFFRVGVDGVFIGPGDLSADLGFVGQPNHPEVQSIIEATIKRIRACGLAPGILTGDETLPAAIWKLVAFSLRLARISASWLEAPNVWRRSLRIPEPR
jgi:2-keto-3-deoxy-L-rhamnonate aldolase RhmA